MRGKCSEGISFNNEKGRGVILVGLPYPSIQAPKVIHKKAFNNYFSQNNRLKNLN